MSGDQSGADRSRDPLAREAFIERAAKSLTELQANVNNLADVMVFLEVLGYNESEAKMAGLTGMYELCERVYERVDFYDEGGSSTALSSSGRHVKVPSARRRLIESLSLATPWLGALALLYVFGVSLWLAWGLPMGPVTALMVGVFLGLLVSEGPLQAFTRVFMFYHSQGNVSECSRALKRSYAVVGVLLACSLAVLALSAFLLKVPGELAALAFVGAVTIAVHRIGYLPIYALKKTAQVVVSYGIALPLLVVVYELTPAYFPDQVVRYLVSLSSALSVLSVFAWYNSKKALVIESNQLLGKDVPRFFKPIFVNVHTISSKFSVQFWEALPYYLSGTFFFILVFGDRVLSWLGNPVKTVGGVELPLVFNSVYHSGADLALAILFPVAVIQYVVLSSVHEELNNLAMDLPVTNTAEVDRFIRKRHTKSLSATLAAAVVAAALVVWFAPSLVSRVGGTLVSLQILYVAALADILLSVFVANSSFILLLNSPKAQAAIAMAGVLAVVVMGAALLPLGFQYLVYAYLGACAAVATLSTVYLYRLLGTPSSLFFARFT